MSFKRYLIRRTAYTALSIYALATILFFLFRAMPGNPTTTLIVQGMTVDQRERLVEEWGLNQPLHVQYVEYIVDLFTFDFGTSLFSNQTIMEIIVPKIMNTLVLMVPGLLIGVSLGVFLGTVYGWYRGSTVERGGVLLSLMGRSVPLFFSGIIIQYVFAGGVVSWFPSGGMVPPAQRIMFDSRVDLYTSWVFAKHVVLPMLAIIVWYSATPALIMRAGIMETVNKEFVKTYRSWGIGNTQLMKYASKHGSLPVITYMAVLMGKVMGGQVLVEVVFAWPGMGKELVDAVYKQDLPLLEATFFLMGVLVILLNFAIDLFYLYVDPRISHEEI